MDISAKISQEDAILLNEIRNDMLKRDVRISQKDLLDKLIKLGMEHQKELLLKIKKEKSPAKDRKDAIKSWMHGQKYDFGDNWLEEIDTIAHE